MMKFPDTPQQLLTRLAARTTGESEADWQRFFELYEGTDSLDSDESPVLAELVTVAAVRMQRALLTPKWTYKAWTTTNFIGHARIGPRAGRGEIVLTGVSPNPSGICYIPAEVDGHPVGMVSRNLLFGCRDLNEVVFSTNFVYVPAGTFRQECTPRLHTVCYPWDKEAGRLLATAFEDSVPHVIYADCDIIYPHSGRWVSLGKDSGQYPLDQYKRLAVVRNIENTRARLLAEQRAERTEGKP